MNPPESGYALGLVGYPLGHSFSPLIHNTWLQALGLPGEYRLYPVPVGAVVRAIHELPLHDESPLLADLLGRLRRGELHGLNVTIPHKQAVLPLVDALTPAARAIGAANTLYMSGAILWGDNTDAPGFLADLTPRLPWPPRRALVLGAGGSARAVVYALAAHCRVSIAARRPQQAEALLALGAAEVLPLEAASIKAAGMDAAGRFDLLVNATPLGMHPAVQGCPWPAGLPLAAACAPGAFIYDLVYNPAQTALLQLAAAQRFPHAGGLGMLVEQAALAFTRWTGQPAPRQAVFAALAEMIPGG